MIKSIEKSGKTADEAVNAAIEELGLSGIEDVDVEVVSEGKTGIFGIGGSEYTVRVSPKNTPVNRVKYYLAEALEKLGLDAKVEASESEEGHIFVDVSGDGMGLIIGRRGDTLDALQYLCSLVANKGENDYIRVTIDTENYRSKREETLVSLARRMAAKAWRSGSDVTLEPMNPNERRIIHSTLQDYKNVTTYSTGEEPNRAVVIALKDKKRAERSRSRREERESYEETTRSAYEPPRIIKPVNPIPRPVNAVEKVASYEEYLKKHAND